MLKQSGLTANASISPYEACEEADTFEERMREAQQREEEVRRLED